MQQGTKTTFSSFSGDSMKMQMSFDISAMQLDLERIEHAELSWIDHFVTQNYNGSWSVIPLRAGQGAEHPVTMIYSDPSVKYFVDTPFLAPCLYFQEVLSAFKTELLAVRLMKLAQGSEIKEHRDYDLDIDHGTVRFHVPVITNERLEFYINNERVVMKEGECWYLKLSDPHRVINNGPDRVHLVLDLKVNDWVRDLMLNGAVDAEPC